MNLLDPLFTNELYEKFITASRDEKDEMKRLEDLRRHVHLLPAPHYETLKFLVRHLRKIADNQQDNMMNVKNLAIMFGPTLVRKEPEDVAVMIGDMSEQCKIIEAILTNSQWFFAPISRSASEENGLDNYDVTNEIQPIITSPSEDNKNLQLLLDNLRHLLLQGRLPPPEGHHQEDAALDHRGRHRRRGVVRLQAARAEAEGATGEGEGGGGAEEGGDVEAAGAGTGAVQKTPRTETVGPAARQDEELDRRVHPREEVARRRYDVTLAAEQLRQDAQPEPEAAGAHRAEAGKIQEKSPEPGCGCDEPAEEKGVDGVAAGKRRGEVPGEVLEGRQVLQRPAQQEVQRGASSAQGAVLSPLAPHPPLRPRQGDAEQQQQPAFRRLL